MNENTMLKAALAYAAMGWHIFPCRPGTKVPMTTNGVKNATTDEATIRDWWTRCPTANIAVACGPASGIYVVDVDVDEARGINGWDSIEEFPPFPDTVRQDTPRGERTSSSGRTPHRATGTASAPASTSGRTATT